MQTIFKSSCWTCGCFLALLALSGAARAATAGAPGPMGGPMAPELSTGAVGAGIVILFGAMFVFFDYRRRKAKAQK